MDFEGKLLLDRYLVGPLLAAGGCAMVHRAEDRALGRTVAIKFLRTELRADSAFVARFEREAQSALQLQHPHIVAVYDYGEVLDTYFLVLQYVPGGDLRAHLRPGVPLPVDMAVSLAMEVAAALGAAHAHGIVHRDVKPANILLTDSGHAMLTDFGIAKIVQAPTLTGSTGVVGTPQYLTPEQVQGGPISPATDVYLLGVVLFEMLAGRRPFEGETPLQLAMQHVQTIPPPVRSLNPAVPLELSRLVARALMKSPAARFPDGGAFLAALRHCQRAANTSLAEAPPAPSLRVPPRRGWGSSPAPALVSTMSNEQLLAAWTSTPATRAFSLRSLAGAATLPGPDALRDTLLAAAAVIRTHTVPLATVLALSILLLFLRGGGPLLGAHQAASASAESGPVTGPGPSTGAAESAPNTPARSAGQPGPAEAPAAAEPSNRVVLDADAFEGGFSSPRQDRGRKVRWLYGALSKHGEMTATFTIKGSPGAGELRISGIDSAHGAPTPIAIVVNDTLLHQGDSQLYRQDRRAAGTSWGEARFGIPEGLLRPGQNTLTLKNLAPVNNLNAPPYLVLDQVVLTHGS